MSLRSIRKRCESALRHIEVPAPFVIEEFCQEISRRGHRPLHLLPKLTRLGPCGVWLALPEGDYIFYESDTSQLHREHIILHELGHLLCHHRPTEVIDGKVLTQLLPSLDPTVVRRVLGRTTYTAVEEQEAEVVASVVRERVEGTKPRAVVAAGHRDDIRAWSDDVVVERLRATL